MEPGWSETQKKKMAKAKSLSPWWCQAQPANKSGVKPKKRNTTFRILLFQKKKRAKAKATSPGWYGLDLVNRAGMKPKKRQRQRKVWGVDQT